MNNFQVYLLGGAIYLALFLLYLGAELKIKQNKIDPDTAGGALLTSLFWPFASLYFVGMGIGHLISLYLADKQRKEKAVELIRKEQESLFNKIDTEIRDRLKKEWIV